MIDLTNENLSKVFQAYDVRGTVPDQLDENFFMVLGKAFASYLQAHEIALGWDVRPDSKAFATAFKQGALSVGCNVTIVGEIATEMIYFAGGAYDQFDGGAVVTASHNPAGWNGCKFVDADGISLSIDAGLEEIKQIMLTQKFHVTLKRGTEKIMNIVPEYRSKVLSMMNEGNLSNYNLIVDAGNGSGGKVFDIVFGNLPVAIERMYFEPDGTFPNHVPNPVDYKNVKELIEKVQTSERSIGIAIDGDADRVAFISPKGQYPSGVYIGALIARHFLKKYPGSKIVHEPRIMWPIKKEVLKYGGEPVLTRAGRAYLSQGMRRHNAVFGVEFSYHFFYRDFYFTDSGMMTIAVMLEMLAQGLDFESELDYLYETYPISGEVNYTVENADDVFNKLENAFRHGNIDHTDGLSIEFPEWRFNIRKSNTEPVVRLNVEGANKQIIGEQFIEVERIIGSKRLKEPLLTEVPKQNN